MAQQRYQNALYLNNAAVTFLTRGAYRHAADAAKGALQLVKFLVEKASDPRQTTKTCLLCEFERTIVKQTTQRLAALVSHVPPNKCPLRLQVVSFDGSLACRHHVGDDWATAIVIEEVSLDEVDRATPPILLSNFALAQWCVRQFESTPSDEAMDGALRLLDIGLDTLGVHQRTMEVTEGNMCVALSILGNICYLLQQCGPDSRHLGDQALLTALGELALLQEVSLQFTIVSSSFVPVAGAA